MKNTHSDRLVLPEVTLCAATSVNVKATIRALEVCLSQIKFAACKIFTNAPLQDKHPDIEVVSIEPLYSSADYSKFILSHMVDHVKTSYCLVAQWDGHILDAGRWKHEFLEYDYIGASWPQFDDGYDVGNGGFSLRSRRLMERCRDYQFHSSHPEDVAIGRTNRAWLEESGMRFAPKAIADIFAVERAGRLEISFGYHGVFNMPRAIGVEEFWQIYRELDDRSSLAPDFIPLLKALRKGHYSTLRSARMVADRVCDMVVSHLPRIGLLA